MTAAHFKERLKDIAHHDQNAIPKRELFSLAKAYFQMPVSEVITLLQDKNEDHRLGAVAILDWKARDKKLSAEEQYEIFRAYIDNHTWIDTWGMVDRAAPYVVGGYLYAKDKTILYTLATSSNPMERRTAIVSTYYFIRKNEIEDTFNIAEILINDTNAYVQKAVGSWIREAGKRDEGKLKAFLDQYAATLPRITLRYALEKFDKPTKTYYMAKKHS